LTPRQHKAQPLLDIRIIDFATEAVKSTAFVINNSRGGRRKFERSPERFIRKGAEEVTRMQVMDEYGIPGGVYEMSKMKARDAMLFPLLSGVVLAGLIYPISQIANSIMNGSPTPIGTIIVSVPATILLAWFVKKLRDYNYPRYALSKLVDFIAQQEVKAELTPEAIEDIRSKVEASRYLWR